MTPPTPPPAPPSAGKAVAPGAKPAPSAPQTSERLAQPLELRFPRLYYDYESVTPSGGGPVEEKLVPREALPTLADVVHAVCQSHGTTDRGLIGDLTSSIAEFLGEEAVAQRGAAVKA